MNALGRKLFRDLWRERARALLVVLAIALGITGFSSVLAGYAILTRELNRGYLASEPASATVLTERVDDSLLQGIEALDGVAVAEARRRLSGRIKTGPGRWRNLQLFVVKDFVNIRLDKLESEAGAWPPAPGEILIERDAFQVLDAKIGDSVIIRSARGIEQTLRLCGSVHDVGQAQARMENMVYGYITVETLSLLGEEPTFDAIKILAAKNRSDEAHIRALATRIEAFVVSQGHPVKRVEVPKPGEHPHAALMGMLLLTKVAFGMFVLILSGILVINLLSALLAAQVRQIGIMKAVGGSRRDIAALYLAQSALLGLAALAFGLPAGLWGSRILSRYLAQFLNFDLDSFAVPFWVYGLVGLVALVIPLLAAAIPVWRGSGVPTLHALSDHGVAPQNFGGRGFERLLAGVGGASRPILLAVRNSFRRRTRLALTVLTLTTAGLFFVAAFNVRAALIHTIDQLFLTKNFDLTVSLARSTPRARVEEALALTPGIAQAEAWVASEGSFAEEVPARPSGSKSAKSHDAHETDRFSVLALPAGSDFLRFQMVAGRAFAAEDQNVVIINQALAALRGSRVGDDLTFLLGSKLGTWKVIGICRESFSRPTAYLPQAFLEQSLPGMTNSLRLRLKASELEELKAALEQNFEKAGIRARAMTSQAESRFSFDQHMLMIYVFLLIMAAILGVVGGLGLATTMSLNVLERRREIGILRALGAPPSTIWQIFVTEGLVIGVLSWVPAALSARPFSRVIGDFLAQRMFKGGLDFAVEPAAPWLWLVISLALAVFASFLPAWSAAHSSLRETLMYE